LTDKKGYYAVLHLNETAREQEIKSAFRREAKLYHPDANPDPAAAETYLKINEAYRVLTDPDARKAYDNTFDAAAGFVPCCRCGRRAKQPRYVLFDESGVLRGGVFCRDCASKQQFQSAMRAWKKIFTAPLQSWRALKSDRAFKNMPADRNYSILMQNAAAFHQQHRDDLARSLAEQARKFAQEPAERVKINVFLDALPETPRRPEPDFWRIRKTDTFRVFLPLFIALTAAAVTAATPRLHALIRPRPAVIGDYEPSAVIPVKFDLMNDNRLYHTVAAQTRAYQAPDTASGVLENLPEQTTVRVTGYIPETDWVQVMTPQGLVVFLKLNTLRKGIGTSPLPWRSKITRPKD